MISIKKKTLSILLVFSLLVGIVAIGNTDTSYAASKKMHLKKTKVTLVVGKTYQQKLINNKGKTIKATKVKWKSSNDKKAKIDKKGMIKAVKKGTVKMTAKYKGKTYKFTVKVKNAPASPTNDNNKTPAPAPSDEQANQKWSLVCKQSMPMTIKNTSEFTIESVTFDYTQDRGVFYWTVSGVVNNYVGPHTTINYRLVGDDYKFDGSIDTKVTQSGQKFSITHGPSVMDTPRGEYVLEFYGE